MINGVWVSSIFVTITLFLDKVFLPNISFDNLRMLPVENPKYFFWDKTETNNLRFNVYIRWDWYDATFENLSLSLSLFMTHTGCHIYRIYASFLSLSLHEKNTYI